MRRAREFLATVEPALAPLDKLKAVVRWMLSVQLAGQMPSLPTQNSSLRATLAVSRDYIDAQIAEWVISTCFEGLNAR